MVVWVLGKKMTSVRNLAGQQMSLVYTYPHTHTHTEFPENVKVFFLVTFSSLTYTNLYGKCARISFSFKYKNRSRISTHTHSHINKDQVQNIWKVIWHKINTLRRNYYPYTVLGWLIYIFSMTWATIFLWIFFLLSHYTYKMLLFVLSI